MKNLLKTTGVFIFTGAMAVTGFIVGLVTFKPECVTINADDKKEGAE